MVAGYGSYATICGVDGNDPEIGQLPSGKASVAKINCPQCTAIWAECRAFKVSQFEMAPTIKS